MESSSTKRKRRRTRKCLDELRKRSRNYGASPEVSLDKFKKMGKSVKQISHNKISSAITSKRLTLKPTTLSRTVKSETISRPSIGLKKALCVVKNSINIKTPHRLSASNSCSESNTKKACLYKDHSGTGSSMKDNGIKEVSFHDNSDQDNISPKSFTLFSPISQAIKSKVVGDNSNPEAGEETDHSSSNCIGYQLYTEFLKQVPVYIEKSAPALLERGIMKKTKAFLQSVYNEGCHRKSEDNILQCMGNTNNLKTNRESTGGNSIQRIVENPLEYIKINIAQKESSAVDTSPQSSTAPSTSLSPSSPALSLFRDTPEYNYYPRKLNQ